MPVCKACGAPLNMDAGAAISIRVGCTSYTCANPCTECGLLHGYGESLFHSRGDETLCAHLRDGKLVDLPVTLKAGTEQAGA